MQFCQAWSCIAGLTAILDTQVLTDLNEGVPPEEADGDKVPQQAYIVTAGQVSKPVNNCHQTACGKIGMAGRVRI